MRAELRVKFTRDFKDIEMEEISVNTNVDILICIEHRDGKRSKIMEFQETYVAE